MEDSTYISAEEERGFLTNELFPSSVTDGEDQFFLL
jgi:hypothetical protein